MRIRTRMPNHPGEIFWHHYCLPMLRTGVKFEYIYKELDMNIRDFIDFLSGEKDITPKLAYKLAQFANTTEDMWIGLQNTYNVMLEQ